MGRHIALFSSTSIPEDEFLELALEAGGAVLDEQLLDIVFHSPSRGTFWIYEARKALQGDFESPYGDGPNVELDEKLHGRARVGLFLYLSSEPDSAGMALELASLVAKRWPTVVSCAAYDVFSADELASLLERQRMPSPLSSMCLVLEHAPNISDALDAVGGIALGPLDQAEAFVSGKLEFAGFDPATDTVEGFFQVGTSDVWVVSKELPDLHDAGAIEDRVGPMIAAKLTGKPRSLLRLVEGPHVETEAATFARRVLDKSGGVLAGVFDLTLAAPEIHHWASSGYGWRLR